MVNKRVSQFLIVIIAILIGLLFYAYTNPVSQESISCGLTSDGIPGVDLSAFDGQEIYVDSSTLTTPENQLVIEGADGSEKYFSVEVANDREERALGLMHRYRLDMDSGMLFLFDDVAERVFWMKNTYIPLDIIFLDEKGVVIDLHKNANPRSTDYIKSAVPAKAALELNAGLIDEVGISKGTKIYHQVFK